MEKKKVKGKKTPTTSIKKNKQTTNSQKKTQATSTKKKTPTVSSQKKNQITNKKESTKMNKKRNNGILLLIIALVLITILSISSSYALFTFNVTKNTNFKVKIGSLELEISDTKTEDRIIINDMVPTKDNVALSNDGFDFTVTNTGTIDSSYSVYLDELTLSEGTKLDKDLVKINLLNKKTNHSVTKTYSEYLNDGEALDTGILLTNDDNKSVDYTLRVWLDYNANNTSQNKYFASKIRIEGVQLNSTIEE